MKAKREDHVIYYREPGVVGLSPGKLYSCVRAYDLKEAVHQGDAHSEMVFLRWNIMPGLGYDTGLSKIDIRDSDIYKTLNGVLFNEN